MTIKDYQSSAYATNEFNRRLAVCLLGLLGEAGEVASVLKKGVFKTKGTEVEVIEFQDHLTEELGDLLWYLANLAEMRGISLSSAAAAYIKSQLQLQPPRFIKFESLQRYIADNTDRSMLAQSHSLLFESVFQLHRFLSLNTGPGASRIGYSKQDEVELFGYVLFCITAVCSQHDFDLVDVAESNLSKITSLFDLGEANDFDSHFPPDERLPRKFKVTFVDKNNEKVRLIINGVVVGDTLTDNSRVDDGYRFHDVFHFTFAAILGWSPVVRSLLKRKRKSSDEFDETEDGARAAIIEEAISLLLFNHRDHHHDYQKDRIDYLVLLKFIKKMVLHLEVEHCSFREWQLAIRTGYSIFAQLKQNSGGTVSFDLDKRAVVFSKSKTWSDA